MSDPPDLSLIHPALAPLAVPIDDLDNLEGNPRRGDVDAVARSYAEFGQRKPITARRRPDGRGEVLAGNHQLAAARQLGWTHIAVVWVDDDDLRAKAWALADNHISDLGGYDAEALAAMLAPVIDTELLAATSYTQADIAAILAVGPQGAIPTGDEGEGYAEQYGVIVIVRDESEQARVYDDLLARGFNCRVVTT